MQTAKYQEGQYFRHNEKKRIFKIVYAEWKSTIQKPSTSKVKERVQEINDWLYDIQYVDSPEYGRYYEGRLTNECTPVNDQDLPKSIYE